MILRDPPDAGGTAVYGSKMADEQIDPGGDTDMFRAFVSRSEPYQERSGNHGPLIVAVTAVVVAIVAFIVIIAIG